MSQPARLSSGSLVQRRLAALGAIRLEEDDLAGVAQSYAPGETIFGDVARDLVANGWSIYPQEIYGDRRLPGKVPGRHSRTEVIKWRENHRLDERLPTPEALLEWLDLFLAERLASSRAFVDTGSDAVLVVHPSGQLCARRGRGAPRHEATCFSSTPG